ncbi:MAG: hypothetical protein H0U74_08870 [Bradymonadaceae bacterium]|nr:hypothetical protein [Lujinxingiaceae bacterium]
MNKLTTRPLVMSLFLAGAFGMLAVPAEADAFVITFGGGLKAGVTGTFVPEVSKSDTIRGSDGNSYTFAHSGLYPMGGAGGAFGLALDVRVLDMIGLETGFALSFDNAAGWNDINDANTGATLTRVNSEQSTTAYHIPLLLRANVPGAMIRPFFGIGLEFVIQSTSTLEYSETNDRSTLAAELNARNSITASNYTLLLLSTGMELKFGPLRVPIEVRAGYNLGFDERATYHPGTAGAGGTPERLEYNGAYQWNFGISTGFLYDFDLLL